MGLRNTHDGFGLITRALHWITALAVLTALPLGEWIADMEVSLASLKYFGLHKTLGVTVLCLIVLRILWHSISAPPEFLSHGVVQDRLARAVHRSFYVLLLLVPLSGWIASSATGIDTVVFGSVTLPRIAPVSEAVEKAGFAVHGALAWLLLVLVLLHVAGALYRSLILGDRTLARMLRG